MYKTGAGIRRSLDAASRGAQAFVRRVVRSDKLSDEDRAVVADTWHNMSSPSPLEKDKIRVKVSQLTGLARKEVQELFPGCE